MEWKVGEKKGESRGNWKRSMEVGETTKTTTTPKTKTSDAQNSTTVFFLGSVWAISSRNEAIHRRRHSL